MLLLGTDGFLGRLRQSEGQRHEREPGRRLSFL